MDSRITLQLSSSSSTNHPETSGPKSLQEEINAMPLVDEDAPEVSDDDSHTDVRENGGGRIPHEASSIESMSSSLGSPAKGLESLDTDLNPDEAEEKERLIQQVLELQHTLDDLSMRVDSVKEENLKLASENQVLSQYIENLMSASNVFQSTSPNNTSRGRRKGKK